MRKRGQILGAFPHFVRVCHSLSGGLTNRDFIAVACPAFRRCRHITQWREGRDEGVRTEDLSFGKLSTMRLEVIWVGFPATRRVSTVAQVCGGPLSARLQKISSRHYASFCWLRTEIFGLTNSFYIGAEVAQRAGVFCHKWRK